MLNPPSGDATDEASSAHGTVIAPVRRNFPLFPARNRAIRPGTGAAAALHIHSGRSGTATDAVAGLRTWSLASMQRARWHHSVTRNGKLQSVSGSSSAAPPRSRPSVWLNITRTRHGVANRAKAGGVDGS